jgi:hypothetical protein
MRQLGLYYFRRGNDSIPGSEGVFPPGALFFYLSIVSRGAKRGVKIIRRRRRARETLWRFVVGVTPFQPRFRLPDDPVLGLGLGFEPADAHTRLTSPYRGLPDMW